MRLYHKTNQAEAIQKSGFRDGVGHYLTDEEHVGVWLSDRSLDVNVGAWGDTLLSIDIPEEEILPYEWREEGKPYREFLAPAAVVNAYLGTLKTES